MSHIDFLKKALATSPARAFFYAHLSAARGRNHKILCFILLAKAAASNRCNLTNRKGTMGLMAKPKWQKWLLPENLTLLEGWARSGLTEKQIVKNMGVSMATLSAWKISHPEILEALKKGKEVADFEVENALYKSALGYFVEEEQEVYAYDPDLNQVILSKKTKTKRYIAPSNTAQIFWLKNRKPADWREKQEVKVEAAEGIRVSLLNGSEDYAG